MASTAEIENLTEVINYDEGLVSSGRNVVQ
ncbi:unnamed protein product, partial [Cyprideis torosa]